MLKIKIKIDVKMMMIHIYFLSYIILDSALSSEGHLQESTQTFTTYVCIAYLNEIFRFI